ncbi:MAG TPA: DNA topoisomerase IB, partial [Myxococcales bacterium]
LTRIIRSCQELPGQELFRFLDADGVARRIASDDVNAYLRETTGRDITAKDFRTWAGTMLAAEHLAALGAAGSMREARRNVNRALDAVAERLGNTRAVCRKYYVHPGLVHAYLLGRTVALPSRMGPRPVRRRSGPAALRRDEVAVLQFLQDEAD